MRIPSSFDPLKFVERLKYHVDSGGDDIECYARARKLELGIFVNSLHTIYLDTNYWVWLRDSHLKRTRGKLFDELHHTLHKLVSEGKIVCPISAYTWFELVRQADKKTRQATAQVIDSLSLGVGIDTPDQRMSLEIVAFMSSFFPNVQHYAPLELVWTKAAYLLGSFDPWSSAFSAQDTSAFQKASFDMFWQASLADIVDLQQHHPSDKARWEKVAGELTEGKNEYPAAGRSFKEMFLIELLGALDASTHIIDSVADYLLPRIAEAMNQPVTDSEIHGFKTNNVLASVIYQGFSNDRVTVELSTFRILASLHAAVRIDPFRKFKANDQYDFGHAAAALPYCKAFFTESPLRHLLVTPPVAADRLYKTTVLSDLADAIDYLKTI